ncbi:MAG TPA: hypothetical protein VGK90_09445 [Rhizomicrobium sp.]|jgi:hypothetical protein
MRAIRFVPFAALALLAGCTMFGGNSKLRNSPAFKEGYEDGCEAATDQGADLRDRIVGDKDRLQSDEAYRAGYNSGVSMCRRTNGNMERLPDTSPPLVPEPGAH